MAAPRAIIFLFITGCLFSRCAFAQTAPSEEEKSCGNGVCEADLAETALNCPEDCHGASPDSAGPPVASTPVDAPTPAYYLCVNRLESIRSWLVRLPTLRDTFLIPSNSPDPRGNWVDYIYVAQTCAQVRKSCPELLAPGGPDCHIFNIVCSEPFGGWDFEPLLCD